MKALKIIAWVAGIIGGLIMIFGVIDFLFQARIFPINKAVNYFITANSFFLLAICCTLCHHTCVCNEEKK